MEISRNEYQDLALTIIYDAQIFDHLNLEYDIREVMSDICDMPYEDIDLFLKEVVVKALNHKNEIIALVQPALNNWSFDRLNQITQSIFLLSVAHYNYVKDVSKAVVINIAVSLAKKFVVEDDYKFINAVLDKVLE